MLYVANMLSLKVALRFLIFFLARITGVHITSAPFRASPFHTSDYVSALAPATQVTDYFICKCCNNSDNSDNKYVNWSEKRVNSN